MGRLKKSELKLKKIQIQLLELLRKIMT